LARRLRDVLRRGSTMADTRAEQMRTDIASVLLALEMLCRRDYSNERRIRIAEIGIASMRKLVDLLLNDEAAP
jgi:hypothetical protein